MCLTMALRHRNDLARLLEAFAAADAVTDRPTVIFAYTIKAWRLATQGHPANHSALLTDAQMRELARATGAAPDFGPAIPGIEHVISSNEAFHLETLPKRVLIQGGGYIAVEFAGIFRSLGADVTMVIRGEMILNGFDQDIRTHLTEEMTTRGIKIVSGSLIDRIEKAPGGRPVMAGWSRAAGSGTAALAGGGPGASLVETTWIWLSLQRPGTGTSRWRSPP